MEYPVLSSHDLMGIIGFVLYLLSRVVLKTSLPLNPDKIAALLCLASLVCVLASLRDGLSLTSTLIPVFWILTGLLNEIKSGASSCCPVIDNRG